MISFLVTLLFLSNVVVIVLLVYTGKNGADTNQALSAAHTQGTAYAQTQGAAHAQDQNTIHAQSTAHAQDQNTIAQDQSTITAYAQTQATQQAPIASIEDACRSSSSPGFLGQSDPPTVHPGDTVSLFFDFLNCDPDVSSYQLNCISNSANPVDVCNWFPQKNLSVSVPLYQAGVFFLQLTAPSDLTEATYQTEWQLSYGSDSTLNTWYITIHGITP